MCTLDAVENGGRTGTFRHKGKEGNVQYLISSAMQTKSSVRALARLASIGRAKAG